MLEYFSTSPGLETLRRSIKDYAVVRGTGGTSKMISPRPGASLAILLKGRYWAHGRPMPKAAVMGIRRRAVQVDAPCEAADRIHVHFRPCGLTRFTGLSAASAVDQVLRAEELFPLTELSRLTADLTRARTVELRAKVLDTFFSCLARAFTPLEEAVQDASNRICEELEIPLADLMRPMPAGVRQVERIFRRLVGVSPRTLRQIARFEKARKAVLVRRDESLTEIGLDNGYYDQAHFNRDFRRFASMPPGSYSFCAPTISDPYLSFPARSHVM